MKTTVAAKYTLIEFVVQGTGQFPVDMLRHDRCVPARETDANEIERTYVNARGAPRRVTLVRYVPQGGIPLPTRGRWESFGWKVIDTP